MNTNRRQRALIFLVILFIGLALALTLFLQGHHTASIIVLLATAAADLWVRRTDRKAGKELAEYSDVPNPSVEEIRAYRADHPNLSLSEAILEMKKAAAGSAR